MNIKIFKENQNHIIRMTEEEYEKYKDAVYCIYQHFKAFWRQAAREEKADFGEPCAECEKYLNNECDLDWNAKINLISPEGKFSPRLKEQPDK